MTRDLRSPAPPKPAQAGATGRTRAALLTLPEQIAERIYASIVHGEYQPGERVREEELAELFGVSRGPVREALRILERDSVVRVVPNRGAHVTPLSVRELNEIFEIRRVLAGAMVRRLGDARPEWLTAFGEKVKELEALASEPDQDRYVAASVELALALAQTAGNERLAEIMRSLARQSWRYTQIALKDPHRRRESSRNWRTLFEALSRGQGEVAGQAMEQLVDDARNSAIRLFEGQATEATAPPARSRRPVPA